MLDKMASMDRIRAGRGGFNAERMRSRSRACAKRLTKNSVQSVVIEEHSSVVIQLEPTKTVTKKG